MRSCAKREIYKTHKISLAQRAGESQINRENKINRDIR